MTEKDKLLLVKFLNLSTSNNDHEALSAIRKANELLKKNNKAWNDLFVFSIKDLKQESGFEQAVHDWAERQQRTYQQQRSQEERIRDMHEFFRRSGIYTGENK